MNKLIIGFLFALLSVSFTSSAEQKYVKGNWDIHYIALPSTFLKPDVAKEYGLTRSKYQAVINISVLDNSNKDKAQRAYVSGFAKNLIGQNSKLSFKQVEEGQAIYYLAQLQYYDNEPVEITVDVQQGERKEQIKFKKKFYVE